MPASNTSLSVLGAAAEEEAAAVGPAVDDIWGGDSWSNAATALRIRSAYTHDGELKEAAAAEEEEEEEEEEDDDDDEEDDEDSAIVSIFCCAVGRIQFKVCEKGHRRQQTGTLLQTLAQRKALFLLSSAFFVFFLTNIVATMCTTTSFSSAVLAAAAPAATTSYTEIEVL